MSLLNVENLTHSFGDKMIARDISFRLLPQDRAGLVGVNGAGKSTLMKLLSGQCLKDGGKIEWIPNVQVGYLDQHAALTPGKTIQQVLNEAFLPLFKLEEELHEITAKMGEATPEELEHLLEKMGEIQEELDHHDFYLIPSKVEEAAYGLGIHALGLDRDVSSLSGGQRTKVLLAKLLLEKPQVLMLDEPTNHLDVEHIQWLKTYLKNYPYAFLLISHDTEFMNDVVNVIFHLESAKLTRYTGNYESFLQLADMHKSQHVEAYEKQQAFIKKQEDFIQRNKARASTSGRAKSREKQLQKIERIDKLEELAPPTFTFPLSRASGKTVLLAKDLLIGYHQPLMPKISLTIERGNKIAVVGCNGIGKSTLLRTLLGEIPSLGGTLEQGDYVYPAYFEQEALPQKQTPLESVWEAYPHLTQQEVRGNLARCGLKPEHIMRALPQLSGGEQAKVRICKLMLKPSNFICFDEPTNHLDVAAKKVLQQALKEYKGTILLISHEPEFYEDIVNQVWNVEDWAQS